MSVLWRAAAAQEGAPYRRWEGVHCTFELAQPTPGVAVLRISGHDVGELGGAPMHELERQMTEEGPVELFIDARHAGGATIDVSGEWARWLAGNRSRYRQISMLTGSRFVALTASFVRRFAELGDVMRIYAEAESFDQALATAVSQASAGGREARRHV